jgi:hypothetical protein
MYFKKRNSFTQLCVIHYYITGECQYSFTQISCSYKYSLISLETLNSPEIKYLHLMCIIEILFLYIFISILSHILKMHEAILSLQNLPLVDVQEKLYLSTL